jgi:hypothetical protein
MSNLVRVALVTIALTALLIARAEADFCADVNPVETTVNKYSFKLLSVEGVDRVSVSGDEASVVVHAKASSSRLLDQIPQSLDGWPVIIVAGPVFRQDETVATEIIRAPRPEEMRAYRAIRSNYQRLADTPQANITS